VVERLLVFRSRATKPSKYGLILYDANVKTCSTCKIEKSLSEFNKNAGRKDGLQSNCRDCNKVAAAAYYERNKIKAHTVSAGARQKYMDRNRRYLFDYLLSHPCIDCGNSDIRVLEFDHVRGEKRFGVGKLARHASSLTNLQSEIDKCDIRCRNCHQIATYDRLGGSWHQLLIDELT